MHRRLAFIIILAAAALCSPDYVVLNVLGETLSAGSWLSPPENDLAAVGSMPNQILPGSGSGVWVVASGNSRIQRLDVSPTSAAVVEEISLPAGSNPYLMYILGDTLYTSLWVTGGLGIVDIGSGIAEATDSFCLGPQGIFADGDYVYVSEGNMNPITYEYGQGRLHRLTRSGAHLDYVDIGTNPQQIIRGPDGNLHVVCTGDYVSSFGMVYIVDPAAFIVTDSVELGGSPARLAVDSESGIIYSATSVWGTSGSGRVLAYDGVTHEVIWDSGDWENAVSGTGLSGLAAFGGYIYLPSMDSSRVEIVQVSGDSLIKVGNYAAGHGAFDVCLLDETDIDEREVPEHVELRAYPVPFNSSCKVVSECERLEIYDIGGRLVDEVTLSDGGGVWTPEWSLPSGSYLIKSPGGNAIPVVYLK